MNAIPIVAIVGRPNVGKSTLFNRLVRRRLAITSPKSGTTRDGAVSETDFLGKRAILVDTGGYRLETGGRDDEAAIDAAVRGRALKEAQKADVILLVLEAGDATAEDEELITAIRPFTNKTIVAVNKTEGGRNMSSSYEWARFGFKDMIFISAEHGERIEDLREAVASKLPETSQIMPSDSGINNETAASEIASSTSSLQLSPNISVFDIRIALVGRPNTGKSTLLNRLTHSDLSIVSPVAGTTRDTVSGEFCFEGVKFCVLDTAGIRRKSRVTESIEYYSVNRAIKTLDDCDIAVILIDSQEGVSEQDKKICDRALDAGRAVIFALSKWDTQPKGRKAARDAVEAVKANFPQMAYSPVVEVSALQGTGLVDLLRTAIEAKKQLERRIETSALNIALHDWIEKRPPPSSKSKRFKPRYITQIGVNPVRFVLFARGAHDAPKTYLTYIKNSIRRDLGFDITPVVLEVRESSRKKEEAEQG